MYLHITPTRLISDLQKEFNTNFPFLKIEFFQNRNSLQSGVLKQFITQNRKIGEVQSAITDADVEIKDDMKVQDLEKMFKDGFGLAVQVFRRSGNLWLETTMTDKWTLEQQNEHGKEISTGPVPKVELSENEYDLSRDADH